MKTLGTADKPTVVGTVSSGERLLGIDPAAALPCDLIEVRLDRIAAGGADPELALAALGSLPLPAILTVRRREEGGAWNGTDEERKRLCLRGLEAAAAVDVELESTIFDEVRTAAASNGKTLIASFHDFGGTPPGAELEAIVTKGRERGAGIVKVAATVHGRGDIGLLVRLLLDRAEESPLCVLGMGPAARWTRLLFPCLGSALTYGYLDEPSAPGQPSCASLRKTLDDLLDPTG